MNSLAWESGTQLLQLARYRELLMVSLVYPEFAEGNHRLAPRQDRERTDHDADFYTLVLMSGVEQSILPV